MTTRAPLRTERLLQLLEALVRALAAVHEALRALFEELEVEADAGPGPPLREAVTEPPPPPPSLRVVAITPRDYERFVRHILARANTGSLRLRIRVLIEQGREMGMLEESVANELLERLEEQIT